MPYTSERCLPVVPGLSRETAIEPVSYLTCRGQWLYALRGIIPFFLPQSVIPHSPFSGYRPAGDIFPGFPMQSMFPDVERMFPVGKRMFRIVECTFSIAEHKIFRVLHHFCPPFRHSSFLQEGRGRESRGVGGWVVRRSSGRRERGMEESVRIMGQDKFFLLILFRCMLRRCMWPAGYAGLGNEKKCWRIYDNIGLYDEKMVFDGCRHVCGALCRRP